MSSVSHTVGCQDAEDGLDDVGAGMHVCETQGFGGTKETI